MYRKYRVILITLRGRQLAASLDSVNGLSDAVRYWFLSTPQGRAVYDDQVRAVALYQFDQATGQYVNVGQRVANSRKQALEAIRILGAR